MLVRRHLLLLLIFFSVAALPAWQQTVLQPTRDLIHRVKKTLDTRRKFLVVSNSRKFFGSELEAD